MPKVFVTRPIPEAGLNILHDALGEPSVNVYPVDGITPQEQVLKGVPGVDAIFAILTETMDARVMDAAGPSLKIIANMAVGYNNVDVEAATLRGIAVTNTPGVLTDTTADLTWALMLAAARRISESERFLREGQWEGWWPLQYLGIDVHNSTLGILGMGRIGQAVARRAAGFNMRVLYTGRSQLPEETEKELNATYVDKARLLADSDFLSIHCPLKPETTHAFGAEEFAAMKRTAILINTARGPVVDEGALVAALNAGEIRAAALDVFEEEPKVHPELFHMENAVIIPHLGSATLATRAKMATIAANNIIACLNGETPPNCVNPEVFS
jgi:glyoxylate reductase